ncbi:hypothetical protein HSX11_21260 [Oxalobacteraceae bacterium]|nr:hypothetical protein [Oxalobacteraceae bacterium]
MHEPIYIGAACALTPAAGAAPDAAMLAPETRARKSGALTLKARMVLAAARRCLPSAYSADSAPDHLTGVSLGTQCGTLDVAEQSLQTVVEQGFRHVLPSWYSNGLPNATSAALASFYNLGGPNLTFMGYQGGLEAIVQACRQLRSGRASAMLAGGFDLPPASLAQRRGDAPDGAVPQAGVALLWLTRARPAGAPLAQVLGWSQDGLAEPGLAPARVAALVAAAQAGLPAAAAPLCHLADAASAAPHDHLAASAPLLLVRQALEGAQPGRHAIVVRNSNAGALCLLIERLPA